MPSEVPTGDENTRISVAEAARRIGSSHPFVVHLCMHGRLGDVIVDPSGQRRILAAAVDAYLAGRLAKVDGITLAQAAQDAGLYDVPEPAFTGHQRDATPTGEQNDAAHRYHGFSERFKDWLAYGGLAVCLLLLCIALATNAFFK
jgi:hypothetical protein